MTLRELCEVIRPAQKLRVKKYVNDPGVLCMRYEVLDESGLVDPVMGPATLDREVLVVHTDSQNERTILIRVR